MRLTLGTVLAVLVFGMSPAAGQGPMMMNAPGQVPPGMMAPPGMMPPPGMVAQPGMMPPPGGVQLTSHYSGMMAVPGPHPAMGQGSVYYPNARSYAMGGHHGHHGGGGGQVVSEHVVDDRPLTPAGMITSQGGNCSDCGAGCGSDSSCDSCKSKSDCDSCFSCDPCGERSRWYASGEVLFMDRTRANRQVLGINALTNTALTTDALDWDFDEGYMVTIGKHCEHGRAELSFMSVEHGTESLTLDDPTGSLFLPFTGVLGGPTSIFEDPTVFPFDAGTQQRVAMESQLYSGELNLIRDASISDCMFISGLTGLRWIHMSDELTLTQQSTLIPSFGEYALSTRNNLVGPQFGVSGGIIHGRFSLRSYAKAGLFGNFAEQSQTLGGITPVNGTFTTFRDQSENIVGLSGMVQMGVTGKVDLARHVSLRGGYHAMYLSGMALAPDQADFTTNPFNTATVENAGSVLYHGASGGVELRW